MTNMSHLPFEVQGMDLLPQRHSMSCWYASARMLLNWKEKQTGPQIRCEIPAELDKQSLNIRDANTCLLYTSPSPRDGLLSRMPSSA